jgi:hypothetical protein
MRDVVHRDRVLVLEANYWCADENTGPQIRDSMRALGRDPGEWIAVIYRPNAAPVVLADCNKEDIGDRVLRKLSDPIE